MDLPIHTAGNEVEFNSLDLSLDIDTINDIIEDDIVIRDEISERIRNIQSSMESIYVLENFHSTLLNRDEVSKYEVSQLNVVTEACKVSINYNYSNYDFGLEGLGEILKKTATSVGSATSSIANTSINVANTATNITKAAVKGVVKAVELSKLIVEKINSAIVTLGSEYNVIASLIEKRWFGMKNLIQVYELQSRKLEERLREASGNSDSLLGNIKVKLNVSKLDQNRKVENKEQFLKVIKEDIDSIVEFLDTYSKSIVVSEKLLSDSMKSLIFLKPYKTILTRNINLFNLDVLDKLEKTSLMSTGTNDGITTTSRVLIGGRFVTLSRPKERATTEHKRADYKALIKSMDVDAQKAKGDDNKNIEVITLNDVTLREAKELLELLGVCSSALENYMSRGIPKLLKDRNFFSRLTETVTGLASASAGFDIMKNFLSNSDNLGAVKMSLPGKLLNAIDIFIKAGSFSLLVGMVGAKTAGALFDWLRKYIISSIFTTMDLQFKITKIMNNIDNGVLDTLVSVRSQCFRVCDKLSKVKAWT